jgi:hypothetical protein
MTLFFAFATYTQIRDLLFKIRRVAYAKLYTEQGKNKLTGITLKSLTDINNWGI